MSEGISQRKEESRHDRRTATASRPLLSGGIRFGKLALLCSCPDSCSSVPVAPREQPLAAGEKYAAASEQPSRAAAPLQTYARHAGSTCKQESVLNSLSDNTLELCNSRRAVVGEAVIRVNGALTVAKTACGKENTWRLESGEHAIIIEVDEDGDFRLRNPNGSESGFQMSKHFAYVRHAAEDEQQTLASHASTHHPLPSLLPLSPRSNGEPKFRGSFRRSHSMLTEGEASRKLNDFAAHRHSIAGAAVSEDRNKDLELRIFRDALSHGRYAAAYKLYQDYGHEAALKVVDSSAVDTMRSIWHRFTESLDEIDYSQSGKDWICAESDRDHSAWEYAFRQSGGLFHLVFTQDYSEMDALTAYIGLCESCLAESVVVALSELFASGVGDADHGSAASDTEEHPNHYTCSAQRQGGSESVYQVSSLDALDEPLRALWVSVYSPRILPTAERPAAEASLRAGEVRVTCVLRPAWLMSWRGGTGFRMTVSVLVRPSGIVYGAFYLLPSKVLRYILETWLAEFPANLESSLSKEKAAIASAQESGKSLRASYYAHIRHHISSYDPTRSSTPALWKSLPKLKRGHSGCQLEEASHEETEEPMCHAITLPASSLSHAAEVREGKVKTVVEQSSAAEKATQASQGGNASSRAGREGSRNNTIAAQQPANALRPLDRKLTELSDTT